MSGTEISISMPRRAWNAVHIDLSNAARAAAEDGDDDLAFSLAMIVDLGSRQAAQDTEDASQVTVALDGQQWLTAADVHSRSAREYEQIGDTTSAALLLEALRFIHARLDLQ
jgi:hypothetical protein